MVSEAQKKAVARYDRRMAKTYALKLNRKTDADIIERLEAEENVQGFLKGLIRSEMMKK